MPDGAALASVEADRRSSEGGSVRSKVFAVGALAAVLVAGCGGESDEASPTEQWAGDVCSAFVDWRAAISGSVESLQDGTVSRSDLEAAVGETADATDALADELRGLEAPETAVRGEAEAALGRLADALEQGRDEMRTAVDDAGDASGVLNAVAVVSGTLVTLGDQVAATQTELEELEASGEVNDAFANAASCEELRAGE
jgi:hypothetical protein